MKFYVNKNTESKVIAIQLSEDNFIEVLTFCNKDNIIASREGDSISINTIDGVEEAKVGDYIVKSKQGFSIIIEKYFNLYYELL